MIDTHCHLADPRFADDLEAVLARAKAAGVERMIGIGLTIDASQKGLDLAEKFEHIFCTVGVHPHESRQWTAQSASLLRAMAGHSRKVKAIGEIGLDYHYDFSPRDVQRDVFRQQLILAEELHLPVVLHCREAQNHSFRSGSGQASNHSLRSGSGQASNHSLRSGSGQASNHSLRSGSGQAVEDVWSIIDTIKPSRLVMHCCTEKWSDVERFVRRGYLLSFTGIATYPKSEEIRATIKECPIDQLMIETDAPFLAPVPLRGKRNEPAFVVEVAKCVAEVKGISLEEVDRVTTENAKRFFGLHHS